MPKVRLRTGESSRPVSRGLGTRRILPDRGRGATGNGVEAADAASSATGGAVVAPFSATSGAVVSPSIGRLRPLLWPDRRAWPLPQPAFIRENKKQDRCQRVLVWRSQRIKI